MRAMIVAAGLGTRLAPLTDLRPKPALPVRGLPLVSFNLALLARHGVTEVAVNVHHRPEMLEAATRRYAPPGVHLSFSREEQLLGTGGGIRRVADFLRESDPCIIIGGDMILDFDLSQLVARHESERSQVTMLLRDDSRAATFGSVGVDASGRVRRIGRRLDLGGEVRSGIYAWANVVSARAFDSLPDREVFGHFDHWIGPMLEADADDVRGVVALREECVWEPVGTGPEYLAANLACPRLGYMDPDERAARDGTRFEADLVIGAGARIGAGASLRRAVVWDGETVPPGFRGADGVFAGGAFHSCRAPAPPMSSGGSREEPER